MRQLVQDTQSRDRMGEYNYFLQQHNEIPDKGKLEGELEQIEYFDKFALVLFITGFQYFKARIYDRAD